MRSAATGVLLALLAVACTRPVEEVTAALTPSATTGPVATPAGDRLTEIVGDQIVVETPFANGDVGTPVSVTGTADVVGAAVTVRVLDEGGSELASTIVRASCGDGCVGTFAAELFYFVPQRTPGWIEVSGASPQGPAPRVRVPVFLFP